MRSSLDHLFGVVTREVVAVSNYTDKNSARFERNKRWKNSKPLPLEEQLQKIEEFKTKQGVTKVERSGQPSQPVDQAPAPPKEKPSKRLILRDVS
jgi:hypothetical protein